MTIAVTTFSNRGLEKYGRQMVMTFFQHWPEQVDLYVYAEGWYERLGDAIVVDLEQASPWLGSFKHRHQHRPTTNFRMDAVRFSHKIAALTAADALQRPDRYLVWMDGDIVTHAPVTLADLHTLTPRDGEWISWLDRAKCYPECGFYIIDRQHERHKEMMAALLEMYDGDKLFLEKEWHDSYILEQVVHRAGVAARSISGDGYYSHHPFINGPLGRWMDHMKGKRKDKGRSYSMDLRVKRQEKYWR